MTALLLWLQFLPSAQPKPAPSCTSASLQLLSTTLSETDAQALARKIWPDTFIVRRTKRGDNFTVSSTGTKTYYSLIEIGFADAMFGFAKPYRETIIGIDKRGSYRRAWNNAMIWRCQKGL